MKIKLDKIFIVYLEFNRVKLSHSHFNLRVRFNTGSSLIRVEGGGGMNSQLLSITWHKTRSMRYLVRIELSNNGLTLITPAPRRGAEVNIIFNRKIIGKGKGV